MGEELAASNVNRSYTLAASCIAIFTFTLFFLFPRLERGAVNPPLFYATLIVLGLATFSFVFSSFHYYWVSLGSRVDEAERVRYSRRADRFWLFGYSLLILDPTLILFSVGLFAVGSVWLGLWVVWVVFVFRTFPRVQAPGRA